LDKDNVLNKVGKGVTLSSSLTFGELVNSGVNDLTILNCLNEVVVLNSDDDSIFKKGIGVLVVDFDDFTFLKAFLSRVGADFDDFTFLNILIDEVLGNFLRNIFAIVLNFDEVNGDIGDLTIVDNLSSGLADNLS